MTFTANQMTILAADPEQHPGIGSVKASVTEAAREGVGSTSVQLRVGIGPIIKAWADRHGLAFETDGFNVTLSGWGWAEEPASATEFTKSLNRIMNAALWGEGQNKPNPDVKVMIRELTDAAAINAVPTEVRVHVHRRLAVAAGLLKRGFHIVLPEGDSNSIEVYWPVLLHLDGERPRKVTLHHLLEEEGVVFDRNWRDNAPALADLLARNTQSAKVGCGFYTARLASARETLVWLENRNANKKEKADD